MSGKPSTSGVDAFRLQLKEVAEAETRMNQLQQEIAEREGTLTALRGVQKDARRKMFALMLDMDVQSCHNTGWEERMNWFLVELYRQMKVNNGKL